MPITPTYPGVYVEEVPSTVRTITSVGTSITAFIGSAIKGPVNDPITVFSFPEYEQVFGGLWKKSSMSYAVYQFFLNGGSEAVIVRVVHTENADPSDEKNARSAIFEQNGLELKFEASNPGSWANTFTISIDHDVNQTSENKDDLFNIVIKEKIGKDSQNNDVFVDRETFRNVSYQDSDDGRYFKDVLDEESKIVHVQNKTIDLTERTAKGDFVVGDNTAGLDGGAINGSDIQGEVKDGEKSGIHALDKTDLFNLLCIPPPNSETISDDFFPAVYAKAVGYCKSRRAMLIVDPPSNWKSKDKPADEIDGLGLQSENAAIYFPRIKAPDPLSDGNLRSFPPSGVVAGIMSKTDQQRGVWKAPAGIETSLIGVPDLEVMLTDDDNGKLNPLGINCLRVLPPAGRVLWGSRTMRGDDRLADQWKYLPVRRTALFIEESLYRGTQWVVFEPNDEPLWAQIRLNVGAFMHDLFTKGAFQGSSPKEAYLVKCDKDTTTQFDIDRGIVNIVVGFAPLKPAEFVIIKIQQLTGQERS